MDIELILAFPSNLRSFGWPTVFILLVCGILKFFDKGRKLRIAENRALKLALLAVETRDDLLLAFRKLLGDLAEREARWRSDNENRASLLNKFEYGDSSFRQKVVEYFRLNAVV